MTALSSDDTDDTVVSSSATRVAAATDAAKPDPFVADVSKRYRVIATLAPGLGDALYLARHLDTDALVELRGFSGDPGGDVDLVDALRDLTTRVARVSGQCSGITTIIECERAASGTLVLAMEHRDGPTLRETIRRSGRLTPERAIPIAIRIAETLERAHNCGLVHGGLRPDNVVLVGPEETVVLTHYGVGPVLARWAGAQRRKGGSPKDHPVYQAPEQASGQTTERSDVYAFGAILYEMLAGWLPPAGIASHRRASPEPLGTRWPDVPPSLERIVARALEPIPERRPDISVLCNDLLAEIIPFGQRRLPSRGTLAGLWPGPPAKRVVAGALILMVAALAIWAARAHFLADTIRWARPSLLAPAGAPGPGDTSRGATAPGPEVPVASPPAPVPSPAPSRAARPPKPTEPKVDARSEPAAPRPRTQDVTAAPPPSAPAAPEPARATREASEDPGAIIDWLLNEGARQRH